MDRLAFYTRFAARRLLQTPGFTFIAVVALGLGIGGVTTQCAVIDAIFLRDLPFPGPEEIMHVERDKPGEEFFVDEVPIGEFLFWQRNQESFEQLAGYYPGTANLSLAGKVRRYDGAFISANIFELLRKDALHGRALRASDDLPDHPQVAVLSHSAWQRDFGGDPSLVGKEAVLNGRTVTIAGIMPEGFSFPLSEDLWVPLLQERPERTHTPGESVISLEVLGRLADPDRRDAAAAELTALAEEWQRLHEPEETTHKVVVRPFLDEFIGTGTLPMTMVMLFITLLLLLIGCANVANLLLARSVRRQKEVAIRSALGATRRSILGLFLAESLLLAALGTVLGIYLAFSNVAAINASREAMQIPVWLSFTLDYRILILTIAVTILTGILSGLFPAWRASRLPESEILKDDNPTLTSLYIGRFSRTLVIFQVAVAAVALSLVVLFIRSVESGVNLEYNYDVDRVYSARIGLFEGMYPAARDRDRFTDELLAALRSRPEIAAAATTNRYQFLWGVEALYSLPEEDFPLPAERRSAKFHQVSRGFLSTMGLPLLSGRKFRKEDHERSIPDVALVNAAFAEATWPGDSPLGKRFRPELGPDYPGLPDGHYLTVIGTVPHMNEAGLFPTEEDMPAFLLPRTPGASPRFQTLLARSHGEPEALLPILREEVRRLDGNLPLYETGTPREIIARASSQFRFFMSIFKGFGAIAAFLAAVGIYGVITFSVQQRIMEYGIRQALGASRLAIFRHVYRHAFSQTLLGLFAAILILSPLTLFPGLRETLSLFFYGIEGSAFMPYLLSFVFVFSITLLAALPPAIRAARIHPASALRYE